MAQRRRKQGERRRELKYTFDTFLWLLRESEREREYIHGHECFFHFVFSHTSMDALLSPARCLVFSFSFFFHSSHIYPDESLLEAECKLNTNREGGVGVRGDTRGKKGRLMM